MYSIRINDWTGSSCDGDAGMMVGVGRVALVYGLCAVEVVLR